MISLERLATRYSSAVKKNPVRTVLITNFAFGCIGDFLCQVSLRYHFRKDWLAVIDRNLTEWSPTRTFRQGLVSVVFLALPIHFWLRKVVPLLTVSKRLISKPSVNKLATTFWRVGMHTAVMMPFMQAGLLFGIGSLKGLSIDTGLKLMNDRFADGY